LVVARPRRARGTIALAKETTVDFKELTTLARWTGSVIVVALNAAGAFLPQQHFRVQSLASTS
jgi:hypothetical protein